MPIYSGLICVRVAIRVIETEYKTEFNSESRWFAPICSDCALLFLLVDHERSWVPEAQIAVQIDRRPGLTYTSRWSAPMSCNTKQGESDQRDEVVQASRIRLYQICYVFINRVNEKQREALSTDTTQSPVSKEKSSTVQGRIMVQIHLPGTYEISIIFTKSDRTPPLGSIHYQLGSYQTGRRNFELSQMS